MTQVQRERDTTGKFVSDSEPNAINLVVRVPASVKARLKAVKGNNLTAWLREVIIKELEREEKSLS